MKNPVLQCATWSVVMSFPAAALVTLIYRFPIPFSGYLSGIEAVIPSPIAVVFFGIMGGFLVLAVLGALGGVAARLLSRSQPILEAKLVWLFSGAVAFSGALFLAILDKLIGPW